LNPPDPSNTERPASLPGTHGHPFDRILHGLEIINRIPAILFALLLLALALILRLAEPRTTLILWSFMLLDWLLLTLLPKAGISYGPAKPPALLLAGMRALLGWLPLPYLLALQSIGTLLVMYGFWIEPQRLVVTQQTLASPKWKGARPLRILHVGDLHIERITGRERKLNAAIQTLQPDLILFSGDILNLSYLKDPLAWEAARNVISQWSAPLGVFGVTGSPAVDLPETFPELVQGLPVRWLVNEKIGIQCGEGSLDIIGLSCSHDPQQDAAALNACQPDAEHLNILLYHTPDLAPLAARAGIGLQLSGHTHGGQVRLPWIGALFTAELHGKRYAAGRYQLDGMTLYVTRGVGMEGAGAPRVRFLCPPEIIFWEITNTSP
jgi:uncharacterized protein